MHPLGSLPDTSNSLSFGQDREVRQTYCYKFITLLFIMIERVKARQNFLKFLLKVLQVAVPCVQM